MKDPGGSMKGPGESIMSLGGIALLAVILAGVPLLNTRGSFHAQLSILVEVGPSATPGRPAPPTHEERASLRCAGSKATGHGFLRRHPKPACRLVATGRLRRIARAQRSSRACSQIYSGPQRAHITGRVGSEQVDLAVTRTDSCGTADWESLRALLGDPERSS